METKIELIKVEEIIKSIQNENELFNKIMPFIKSIDQYAFRNSQFRGEFNCPNLTSVGNGAFAISQFTGDFNCPNLTYIGQYAFLNSNFTQITIGANAILNRGCIGAHSEEFINDYEANGRQAGTYVWNGEHWIYQKNGGIMKTQEKEHIYADVRKSMNSEEFEKSIESVVNDYNVSKEEKVVKLFKLGLYPTDILEYIRVGLAEVYYILDLAKKEGKFNDKLN